MLIIIRALSITQNIRYIKTPPFRLQQIVSFVVDQIDPL